MSISNKVALLAPIPSCYLNEAQVLIANQGKVAFGSRAWETFRKLDTLRGGELVEVLIYASQLHPQGPIKPSWKGIYQRHIETHTGTHPDNMRFRPPSTANNRGDNKGYWALFWEMIAISPLHPDQQLPIQNFRGFGKKRNFSKTFIPRGPIVIEPN